MVSVAVVFLSLGSVCAMPCISMQRESFIKLDINIIRSEEFFVLGRRADNSPGELDREGAPQGAAARPSQKNRSYTATIAMR